MKASRAMSGVGIVAVAIALAGCAQTGPVEFSLSADAPNMSQADDLDFGPMDQTISACKAAARQAGPGQCTQVRAYEACMKTKGYVTVLGPENPPNCGQPAWESDVRKWLKQAD